MGVTILTPFEEEQKRRAEAARARGWDEATIQRFQLIDRVKQQQTQAKAVPAQPEKPKGAFRSNSALGFGVSLLPFGEVLRKKLNKEQITGGDVALETVLTALPLAGKFIGKGVKAARGVTKAGKAAKITGEVGKVADDANKEKNLLKALIKGDPEKGLSGKITKGGEILKAEARGVKPAIKPLNAADPLYTQGVKDVTDTLNTVERNTSVLGRTKTGTKGSATRQLSQVEKAQEIAGKEIDDAIANTKKPIFKREKLQEARDNALKDVVGENGGGVLEMTPKHNNIVTELDNKIASVKDVRGAVNLKREVQGKIKFNRNTASPDNTAEKIYEIYRRKLDEVIDSVSPEIKTANQKWSKLETAKNVVVQNTPGNLKQSGNAGPTGRLLNNSLTQIGLDKTGRALTRTGKITASPLTKQAAVRLPFSAANAGGASATQELPADVSQVFANPQSTDEELLNQAVAEGINDPQTLFDLMSSQDQPTEDATQDETASTGSQITSLDYVNAANQKVQEGDLKTAKSLFDFAQVVAEFEKTAAEAQGGGNLDLSDTAIKTVSDIEKGVKEIGIIGERAKQNYTGGPVIGDIKKFNPFDSSFKNQQADIDRVRQIVGKAMEGGVLRKEDEEKYKRILPTLSDPSETFQYKVQEVMRSLQEDLERYLMNQQQYGKGSTDVTNLFTNPATNMQGAF